jgi:phage-related protein
MVPFNYMFTLVGNVASQLVKNIQSIRKFIDSLREKILRAIQEIMGVVLNVIITFQKIIISMRDMMNKFVGIFATVLHLMLGCLWTVKSMWAGVAGTLVRSLGSA